MTVLLVGVSMRKRWDKCLLVLAYGDAVVHCPKVDSVLVSLR